MKGFAIRIECGCILTGLQIPYLKPSFGEGLEKLGLLLQPVHHTFIEQVAVPAGRPRAELVRR